MYAIIQTGGKQYRVEKGDIFDIERLPNEEGDIFDIEDVLAVKNDENFLIGTPYVENAKVKAKVVEHGLGDTVIVFKYKPKKGYRRRQDHRQPYTRISIEDILIDENGNTETDI